MKDNKTGTVCKTAKDSKTCNTQACGPTITRVGEYLTGLISPLNTSQIVRFESEADKTCGGKRRCGSCSIVRCSKVDAQVINVNGKTVSYGPVQHIVRADDGTSTGNNGNGIGTTAAVRIDNNTIAFSGANYRSKNKTSSFGIMIVKVNGNSVWVSQRPDSDFFDAGISSFGGGILGMYHDPSRAKVVLHYECGSKTKQKNCYVDYYYNAGYREKRSGSLKDYWEPWNDRYDKEGRVTVCHPARGDTYGTCISLNNGSKVLLDTTNDKYSTPSIKLNGKEIIPMSSWSDYGSAKSINHIGNDIIVLHVSGSKREGSSKNYTYYSYFIFYRNVNGVWTQDSIAEAPGHGTKNYSGELIALNSTSILFNSKSNGLYLIEYS